MKESFQKSLSKDNALILIILVTLLFIFYESVLFNRLQSRRYINSAWSNLKKVKTLDNSLVVEKAIIYRKTLKLIGASISLNPYDSRGYFEYAKVLTEMADNYEIRGSLDIKSLGAEAEGQLGFYELARAYYEKALSREPTNAIYHQRLGMVFDKLEDQKSAEEQFRKAVWLDPHNITIHLSLSQYFLLKGRQEEFASHLKEAVELYKLSLRGGPLANMVQDFLKAINREDLI